MNPILENAFFQLVIHSERAAWSLAGRGEGSPALEGVRMGLDTHSGRGRARCLEAWPALTLTGPEMVSSPHGPLRTLTLNLAPDKAGVHVQLLFALPEEHPLLLWKMVVENGSSTPLFLDRFTLLQAGASPSRATANASRDLKSRITFHSSPNLQSPISNLHFFSNGWQSWSYTGAYTASDRFRRTRLGTFREPTEPNPRGRRPSARGNFTSEMFGVLGDPRLRRAVLAGFLSQQQHFGSLEAWISAASPALHLWADGDGARLDPGASIHTDWACLTLLNVDDPDPLGPYLEAVSREHGLLASSDPFENQNSTRNHASRPHVSRFKNIHTGWCSWYQYSSEQYTGALSAQDIRSNVDALRDLHSRLPLEILQIDDGFQAQVGDWFDFAPSFPQGVAPLAAEIKAAGFTPGLWLAPFIVHPRSRLAAQHPDWLLRGRYNRPVNAGYLWNRFATALDLTDPAALEYASETVHTAVHRWGFPFLKLDFLYAAALPGRRRDATRTRAQTLRLGLEALRQAAGEGAALLGCGCPLGPAIGLVDAMRIGADTARRWNPAFNGLETFFEHEPNLPSARNAIHNTLTRSSLHRRWWVNDPDCLLLRPQTHLTLEEVHTAATAIALTGSSVLLSDDMAALPPERIRIGEILLPPIEGQARVLDWFDSASPSRLRLDLQNSTGAWHLLARINWEDQTRDLAVILSEYGFDAQICYFARDFWNSQVYRVTNGVLPTQNVPAHGVVLLALRPAASEAPLYLGSDLHISQGLEATGWSASGTGVHLNLERPRGSHGQVDLRLSQAPKQALLDGSPVVWERLQGDIFRFYVALEGSGSFDVSFE